MTPNIAVSVALLMLCPIHNTRSNWHYDVNYFPALSFVVVAEGTTTTATTTSSGPTMHDSIRVMQMRLQNKPRRECLEELNDEGHEYSLISDNEVIRHNHHRSSYTESSLSIACSPSSLRARPSRSSSFRRKENDQKQQIVSTMRSKKENKCYALTSVHQCNANSYRRSRKLVGEGQRPNMMVQHCSSSSGSFNENNGNTNVRYSSTTLDFPQKIKYIYDNDNDKSGEFGGRSTSSTPLKKVLSPPSVVPPIKLKVPQPRKKELWLPWPLGAIRNDFYSFAESEEQLRQRQRPTKEEGSGERIWRKQHQQPQWPQWQIIEQNSIIHRSRDWASKMLHRGGGSLRMTHFPSLFHDKKAEKEDDGFTTSGRDIGHKNIEHGSVQRYWSKDPTTSMATASATGKKGKNNKIFEKQTNNLGIKRPHQQQQYEGTVRGGENSELEPSRSGKTFDKDVVFRYLKLQASVRLRQLGYVGSDFSIHLPPAAPVLLFYYMLPSKQDPIRRLVKYSLTGATLSWMHSEATKYRRFSPLPVMKGVNVRQPNLPPFLPEEWTYVDGGGGGGDSVARATSRILGIKKHASNLSEKSDKGEGVIDSHHTPHHLWDPFQSFGTISSAYRTWLEGHNMRNKHLHQQRRMEVQDQLLVLKKSASMLASNSTSTSSSRTNSNVGYALVTGASSGIGRALAVELARYRIPLILVARDLSRLRTVAEDIETHYDVPCRILRADLSSPDSASRIHAATKSAGLIVDILVNNAGVCTHGDFVDGNEADMAQMMLVNIGAVTQLSRLYGGDMKERRRGRILFVSSMSGVLPGNPGVAVYAASTAYKKSLAISLGREMERFGVGVTCLLPGAVKDTSFAKRSGVEQAACFHFPGYAKSAEEIAGEGIKGIMLGYPEIYPGWQNRVFAKAVLPMLPPRFSLLLGEWAWNPWQWGDITPQRRGGGETTDESTSSLLSFAPSPSWKFLRPMIPSNQINVPELATGRASHESEAISKDIEISDVEAHLGHSTLGICKNSDTQSEDEKINDILSDADSLDQTKENNAAVGNDSLQDDNKEKSKQARSNQIVETRNTEVVVEVPSLECLELPPASLYPNDIPTSLPGAVGFFATSKSAGSTSSNESQQNQEESRQSSHDSDQVWYPSMMDKKDYDFFDRRLNYD